MDPAPDPSKLHYLGPDINISAKLIGATVPLIFLSTLLCALRIYTRIRPIFNWGWDDSTISMSWVCITLQWSFIMAAIAHGYGRHALYLTPENQRMTGLALFASQIPWTWGVSLAKISISFLLLRIKHTIRWQIFLYTMIIILVANSISANIFQLGLCRPLASIWDPFIPVKHCWPIHYPRVCIIVNAVVNIVTDVLFTLIPLTFIYKIRRPLREKILLGFLLGLGIVASAASIVKVTLADEFPGSTDQTYDSVELSMWSIIEGNTTIIAACAPCLKSPAERALRRLGLLSLHEASGGGSPEHPPDGEGARLRVDSAVAFYHEEMERILSPAQASTPPQV